MTPDQYLEQINELIEAYTLMFSAALEAELLRLVELQVIMPETAVSLYAGVKDTLMGSLDKVAAQGGGEYTNQ